MGACRHCMGLRGGRGGGKRWQMVKSRSLPISQISDRPEKGIEFHVLEYMWVCGRPRLSSVRPAHGPFTDCHRQHFPPNPPSYPGPNSLPSEIFSRPSLQNLPHSNSDGGNGRGESSGHSVGNAVSRRLAFLGVGDPRSSSTTSFLPPRSHSSVDSNSVRDVPSNMSSSTLVSISKQHVLPSKVCVGHFYSQF